MRRECEDGGGPGALRDELAALERRVEDLERVVAGLVSDRDRREEDDCK